MRKQILSAFLITLILIGVLGYFKYLKISAAIAEASKRVPPPEAVTSAVVQEVVWPRQMSDIGTIAPVSGAILGAEETGKVVNVLFESGEAVTTGQVLVELDTSVEQAQLQGAQAQWELAAINAKRARELRQRGANAPAELDAAEAALRNAQAEVTRLKALIQRKTITAPFAGKTGIRMVNVGQIVMPGTPIVSLQAFDPLFVNFSLPQQAVSSLTVGTPVELTVDAYPDQIFKATLTTIEPQVEASTRMIKLQATAQNPEQQLRPGMFANTTVMLPRATPALQIPASGVQFAPYGDAVFVIERMKTPQGADYLGVRRQTVKLGERRGDLIQVLSGLKPGEQIVSSGVFKLRPNASVMINNSVAPGAELAPRPSDT